MLCADDANQLASIGKKLNLANLAEAPLSVR